MLNSKLKKVVWVYVIVFIVSILLRIMVLPNSEKIYKALWLLILFFMMFIFEYIKHGMGTRFFVNFMICLGVAIGIFLGLSSNPDVEIVMVRITNSTYPFVLLATYNVLVEKNILKYVV